MDRTPLLSTLLLLIPVVSSAQAACPADWRAKKTSDCWYNTNAITGTTEDFYVHKGGWLVRRNCMDRYGWDAFLNALTAAWKKMNPAYGVGQGGCMSRYNQQKGQDWVDLTWRGSFVVTCDDQTQTDACAATSSWPMPQGGGARYQLISLKKTDPCTTSDSTGLPGILFHETLHALSVTPIISKHNAPDTASQAEFVQDRVYGAEIVCYHGFDANTRKYVSFYQCNDLMDGNDPNNLCSAFSNTISQFLPPNVNKREGP